jgi:hypothetical protein
MSEASGLSRGGPVGIAWQTVLARKGVDLDAADVIVGTRAGQKYGKSN